MRPLYSTPPACWRSFAPISTRQVADLGMAGTLADDASLFESIEQVENAVPELVTTLGDLPEEETIERLLGYRNEFGWTSLHLAVEAVGERVRRRCQPVGREKAGSSATTVAGEGRFLTSTTTVRLEAVLLSFFRPCSSGVGSKRDPRSPPVWMC